MNPRLAGTSAIAIACLVSAYVVSGTAGVLLALLGLAVFWLGVIYFSPAAEGFGSSASGRVVQWLALGIGVILVGVVIGGIADAIAPLVAVVVLWFGIKRTLRGR